MNYRLSPKIQPLNASVIREMTRLAAEEKAINLSQGLPDFPIPMDLKLAASRAIFKNWNQYSYTYGLSSLRKRLAEKLKRRNQIEADPRTEITITCGVSEGIFAACMALSEPGDEFILLEPYYENYLPAVTMAGGMPRFYALKPPDWTLDPDALGQLFSSRTKAIIINNPMNPIGKCFSRPELTAIAQLCQHWNVMAITDEIYEDIIFDGLPHISLASLPGMAERTITIMGFSKTYAVTGWRVGYVCAPAALSSSIRKVHDYLTICAPTPLQNACLTALALPSEFYQYLRHFYEKRRNLFCLGLRDLGFQFHLPQSTYYVMADFSEIFNGNDHEFSHWLVQDKGVAVVPGSSFYQRPESGQQLVRFCFAKREKTLIAALRRMGRKIRTSPGRGEN
ncbi:aminotransferase class I/II-fold pyridoxal phosphate-dependent enzyme [candidate division KSB1 bacterium]|nr:aminotransferase class I/II-fold pyridoxal phosphate-dependent enzyme [candidate division KSB1 bacterium]